MNDSTNLKQAVERCVTMHEHMAVPRNFVWIVKDGDVAIRCSSCGHGCYWPNLPTNQQDLIAYLYGQMRVWWHSPEHASVHDTGECRRLDTMDPERGGTLGRPDQDAHEQE